VTFVVLATANAAGYRYGVSDQAFYIPVVMRALRPGAFPRDAALIDAQGHLMLADEALAGLLRLTHVPLEWLFLGAFLLSLGLIWLALTVIGRHVMGSTLGTLALGAVFTLRHNIPKTSANSFEGYFHPRMLAFAFGALALAAILRRRPWAAGTLVVVACLVHVTTGVWFAAVVGMAIVLRSPRWRVWLSAGAATGVLGLVALLAGPFRSRLVAMDDAWLRPLGVKDSLFATGWPAWAWVANLGLLAALWWAHRTRRARGEATVEDDGIVWGCTLLVAFFLATLPAVAAGTAFFVQLQISRVFWIVDFVATIYLLATVTSPRAGRRVGLAIAAALVAISAGRGVYGLTVDHPERALFQVRMPPSPWLDAMGWLSRQPADVHVLADPGHAWKYGSSVRVAAGRDVLLEETKDAAVGIYSRDVALRVRERTEAIDDFPSMTADKATALAARYGLDYLVTEADLALPIAYRNERFRIYALGTESSRHP
jgi:hypothetical protein